MRSPLLLIVPFLLLFPTQVDAFHTPSSPIVSTGTLEGRGWTGFLVDGTANPLAFEVRGTGNGDFAAGISLFANGKPGVATAGGWFADRTGPSVQTTEGAAEGLKYEIIVETPANGTFTVLLNLWGAGPGTYGGIVWTSGDIIDWSWTVSSPAPHTLVGFETGTRTFLATSKDFTGPANVQAFAKGIGARASIDAHYPFTVEKGLVGTFGRGPYGSQGTLTATTPTGERQCLCDFRPLNSPPGAYTLHTTGAGAPMPGFAEVTFIGADARLPLRTGA